MGEVCWSVDDETFEDELTELLERNDTLRPGDTIYKGIKSRHKTSDYFDVNNLLEEIENSIFDRFGEISEGFPEVSEAEREELKEVVSAWLNAHCPMPFFAVDDSESYTLTEEDFAYVSIAE